MFRSISLLLIALAVAACSGPTPPTLGPDGQPLPRLYRITPGMEDRIQFRMLDSVNSLRNAAGAAPVTLDAELTAAAATHARDMSVQNRPWHFGSDGSSFIERARRAGYTGRPIGENISETYETEVRTLAAWMDRPDTRRVILDARARDMGFAFFQEDNGKIWWTLLMGGPGDAIDVAPRPDANMRSTSSLVNQTALDALE